MTLDAVHEMRARFLSPRKNLSSSDGIQRNALSEPSVVHRGTLLLLTAFVRWSEWAVRLQHLQDRDKLFARSNARTQRVIEFGLAEEGRLLLNLRAIADDDDLHVGRV